MSGSFVRFGVVVFKRRRRHPYNRRSSSVGYLHCRRNEFLPVNKRVDFTTVNQATRRFRPLRLWNLCPPLSIAPCSFFFFFFTCSIPLCLSSPHPSLPFLLFYLWILVILLFRLEWKRGFFIYFVIASRCLARRLRWIFIKLKLLRFTHRARETVDIDVYSPVLQFLSYSCFFVLHIRRTDLIYIYVCMRYITYLNWKFDKYSRDSIKYFKVSDWPRRPGKREWKI